MSVTLTNDERLAVSAVVHQNYYMPDVFAVVEQIVEGRLSDLAALATPENLAKIRKIGTLGQKRHPATREMFNDLIKALAALHPANEPTALAWTPDEEIERGVEEFKRRWPEKWEAWLRWLEEDPTPPTVPEDVREAFNSREFLYPKKYTLPCLDCDTPREVDPLGPMTLCAVCGGGFVKGP